MQLEQARAFGKSLERIRPGPTAHRRVYNIVGYRKNKPVQNLLVDGVIIGDESQCLGHLKQYFDGIYNRTTELSENPGIEEIVDNFISTAPTIVQKFDRNFSSLNEDKCFTFVTLDEVISHSKSINNKKSAGLDNISNYIVRKLPTKAFEYLTIIFNNCISNSYFPEKWKTSKIIPIRKKANDNAITNLRPISLL